MPKPQIKKQFALHWLFEPLMEDPTYAERRMFGALVAFIDGRQVVAITDGDEPWNGVLVMTDRAHHESLKQGFPDLTEHAILGKWLYLSQASDALETVAPKLIRLILKRDPRFGIDPKLKKPKAKKSPQATKPTSRSSKGSGNRARAKKPLSRSKRSSSGKG